RNQRFSKDPFSCYILNISETFSESPYSEGRQFNMIVYGIMIDEWRRHMAILCAFLLDHVTLNDQ
ncbi:hypothetical protein ACFLZE_04355, partial [Thermodesulfobacteriota bacterium]